MKPRYWRITALFTAMAAMALLVLLPIRGRNLTSPAGGWTVQGCFIPGGVYPATFFGPQITAHERAGVTLYGSHCGSDASTGELRSPVFAMPTILELFVAGYAGDATKPGLQLFIERESDHSRLSVPVKAPGERWIKVRWWAPPGWRGQSVRLVAIDHEAGVGGWLGVSNPRRISALNYFRYQIKVWAQTTTTYLFQLALFWLPGLAAACWIRARAYRVSTIGLVIVLVCTGSVLGYASFWAFFFSKSLGQFLTFAVYAASLAVLFAVRRVLAVTVREVREPFLFAGLAGLCYLSFYFLYSDPYIAGIGYASDRFFAQILPGDNVIPSIFADRIYNRKPVRPFCCDGWLSSDRPPLQAGIVLLEQPIAVRDNTETGYEILSSALQCSWICGVWCLLASLRTDERRRRQILGFLIFSGFLLYNSLYTWPKLLAAAFILFVWSLLFEIKQERRPIAMFEAVLAACSLGLALMAHPGATFSLAVFIVLLWQLRHFVSWRSVAVALLIVLAFYVPWSLYQKYADPPGNRLLKMHLAGVMAIDSRTVWQALRDSYAAHDVSELLKYKWLNIAFLAGEDFWNSYGLSGNHESSRTAQRFYMWNAAGLVNVGWMAALYLLVRKRMPAHAGWLMLAGLGNLLFWSVVTFGPNETQTAHSSYADLLLISVGLLLCLLALPRAIFGVLLVWQLWNFFAIWVLSAPARIAYPITLQWPMLTAGVCLTLGLLWLTQADSKKISMLR